MVEQIPVLLYFSTPAKKKSESRLMVPDLVGIFSNLKFSLKVNKCKLPGKLYIHPPELWRKATTGWKW